MSGNFQAGENFYQLLFTTTGINRRDDHYLNMFDSGFINRRLHGFYGVRFIVLDTDEAMASLDCMQGN